MRVLSSRDIGSRCLLYCYTMGSDLSQPTSTSLFPTTSCFVPIAKEFLCVMCSFLNDSIHSTSTSGPICLMAHTLVCRSTCHVCSYTDAFSTAVFLNWPANLMCWNALPYSLPLRYLPLVLPAFLSALLP